MSKAIFLYDFFLVQYSLMIYRQDRFHMLYQNFLHYTTEYGLELSEMVIELIIQFEGSFIHSNNIISYFDVTFLLIYINIFAPYCFCISIFSLFSFELLKDTPQIKIIREIYKKKWFS